MGLFSGNIFRSWDLENEPFENIACEIHIEKRVKTYVSPL